MYKKETPVWLPLIIVVKNLVRVLQDRVHDANLPAGVRDVGPGRRAHEGWAEHDGQVLTAHAVDGRVVDDAVQVQGQRAQRGIVGVRKTVDDGV